jgi:hypothetical protein
MKHTGIEEGHALKLHFSNADRRLLLAGIRLCLDHLASGESIEASDTPPPVVLQQQQCYKLQARLVELEQRDTRPHMAPPPPRQCAQYIIADHLTKAMTLLNMDGHDGLAGEVLALRESIGHVYDDLTCNPRRY